MAGGRALQDTLAAGAEYRSPLADDAGRADRAALGRMARQADRRGRAVRPGLDAQRDDPPPACAGAGAHRGVCASESRPLAPVARGGAVFQNVALNPPRRAGARRKHRRGARRDRLFGRRDRRVARRRRVRRQMNHGRSRRELCVLLGMVALWPAAAVAAQAPVIGFLSSRSAKESEPLVAAFREGLKEAGYIEGQNAAVVYEWAENRYE